MRELMGASGARFFKIFLGGGGGLGARCPGNFRK